MYEFQVIISFEILSVYFIPGEIMSPAFMWWLNNDESMEIIQEIILMKIPFLEQATQPLASVKMQWKHKTE